MMLQEDLMLFQQDRLRYRCNPTRLLGWGFHLSNTFTSLSQIHSWRTLHWVHIFKKHLIPGCQDLLTVFCLLLWLIGNCCLWSLLCGRLERDVKLGWSLLVLSIARQGSGWSLTSHSLKLKKKFSLWLCIPVPVTVFLKCGRALCVNSVCCLWKSA